MERLLGEQKVTDEAEAEAVRSFNDDAKVTVELTFFLPL